MKKKTYTGINIQWPISQEILLGKKIIETRTYPLPNQYLGVEMILIETPGPKGKFKSRIVAFIQFDECFPYPSKEAFYADNARHLVDRVSPWAWTTRPKWGWRINAIRPISPPVAFLEKKGIIYTRGIEL